MTTIELDQDKAKAFAGRMLAVLNDGAIALMTSIGHRTGLFDTMANLSRATSTQIAKGAGLNERYVREWLGAMVTARIVVYDPHSGTYTLPPEHAAWLTRSAARNFAVTMQFLPLLGAVQDGIVAAFRDGGGLHYHDYPGFHNVMAEASGQAVVVALVDAVLPLVPGLTEALRRGIEVLDLGCGQGRALIAMARSFPNSRFTGYDLLEDTIAAARRAAAEQGLANVHLDVHDAAQLDESSRYDLICTFDAIHDQANPARVLRNIAGALRPDGVYLMQDIRASSYVERNLDHPAAPFLYTISTIHCTSVSLAQGGAGLGTVWGEELALEMLAQAGFSSVEVKQLPHDILNSYYIARKRRD
jgi:2-polyprenyl-3-methyl-5-hydroxy-6-metoxy-1,4-benzoquinol methylase